MAGVEARGKELPQQWKFVGTQHSRFVSVSLVASGISHAPIPAASSSRSFGSLT
jgi:hypothetical protein